MRRRRQEENWHSMPARAYHLHEWTLQLKTSGNPFAPAENDVVAEVRLPDGKSIRQPAFWDGDSVWKVRLTPLRSGRLRWRILRNGQPVEVQAEVALKLISPQAIQGFVRRHPRLPHFVTDRGKVFFPIGQNVGWRSPGVDYPDTFAQMGQEGMNWARVWLCHWDGKNPDWVMGRRMEIGWLDMEVVRRLEEIVNLAEKHGIFIQLVLQHHGQYSSTTNPNWQENPWNERNGGFLASAEQFFTHPRAMELTRDRYRYFVARWGYSPHILAWELFNEVEWTDAASGGKWDTIAQWHRQMAGFLRFLDVHKHLVTTSSAMHVASLWTDMDCYQPHYYVPDIAGTLLEMHPHQWSKPIFIGEWGGANPRQWGDENVLRQGLWVGVMRGLAGGAQWWSWEVTEERKWYSRWGSLTRFLRVAGFPTDRVWQPISALLLSDARAAYRFSPGGGWESTQKYRFVVPNDGSPVEGLSKLSRFVQGESHRTMFQQPVVLEVNYPADGTCTVLVGTVARSGAAMTVKLDGRTVIEETFPPAQRDTGLNREFTFAVPAGKHTISIFNPGVDWFTLDSVTLSPYAPPSRVAACGDGQNAMWYLWREQPNEALMTLRLSDIKPGRYRLVWWEPTAGKAMHNQLVTVKASTLEVAVPAHERDIAGCLFPAGRRVSL